MNEQAKRVQRTYVAITLLSTLSASFIWGVNTLFLLDAGLSNTAAFAANAFFTVGQVLFEIPTGVVADSRGRRTSFLLGSATLLASTILYLVMWNIQAPFIGWAIASVVLGLGFTFFSGAVEAWLVDALKAADYHDDLESVLAKGQITAGIAMLSGSVAGGFIAQLTNLGVPYILRCIFLALSFILAFAIMRDEGFTPDRSQKPLAQMKTILNASLDHGIRDRNVRWVMLAAPMGGAVGVYAFYAMQPYLLELYGNPEAYGIAGLAAAIIAGAQIAGGILVPFIRKLCSKRSTILIASVTMSSLVLLLMGIFQSFWVVLILLVIWAMMFAASMPVRSAYLNKIIPSKQRATVLSFDALLGSSGGVISQPALGRVADVYSYSTSYVVTSAIQILALPFLVQARRESHEADTIK